MARVLIVGGGIVGSSVALLAANDGHEVTLFERDAAPPPASADEAWDHWERRGVNQFRLLHYFLARFRQIVTEEMPDVVAALDADGALRVNPFTTLPESLSGGWRPDDDRFEALTGRRPMVEAAFARVIAANPKINVRRGTAVRGLLVDTRAGAIPHVDGVVTDKGEEVRADLVVDAGGRRSALPAWLDAIGCHAPIEEMEDCGFVYYGRYFRSGDGSTPFAFGPLLQHYESFSTLTLPADNGTWGIGVITSAGDAPTRALAHDDAWERVVRSCPLVAHWLDGTSMQSVAAMAKIEDRIRTYVVDGVPVVTGIVAVGDAWACTNPSVGRGATIGVIHAVALRDLLREREGDRAGDRDDAAAFARRWADFTTTIVAPFVRDTLSFDRHRLAQIDAQIAGHPYVTDDQSWIMGQAIANGAGHHPELLRGAVDLANLLASPAEVFTRPGVEGALAPFIGRPADLPPGPSRAEFLGLLHSGI
ncbi:MAG TPA: FAD-dependent oxidoreductase [Acidimicrobiales bacterium]|nr:FAD-dependent oxidoreductase [Acidimicrobiales bacterium]